MRLPRLKPGKLERPEVATRPRCSRRIRTETLSRSTSFPSSRTWTGSRSTSRAESGQFSPMSASSDSRRRSSCSSTTSVTALQAILWRPRRRHFGVRVTESLWERLNLGSALAFCGVSSFLERVEDCTPLARAREKPGLISQPETRAIPQPPSKRRNGDPLHPREPDYPQHCLDG